MNEVFFYLFLILIPVLAIGGLVFLSMWIYRTIKKKGVNKVWRVLAIIPVLVVAYFTLFPSYPSADIYEQDFEEVTGTKLPKGAGFNFKTASGSDQHEDYTSVTIIDIGTDSYQKLQPALIKNGLSENGQRSNGIEKSKAEKELNGLEIEREFSKSDGGNFYYVAFLSDKRTILIQRTTR